MSYTTLEVEFDHGRVVPKEAVALPESGRGLLTILPPEVNAASSARPVGRRVMLPIIQGDGSRIINPTPAELDASHWE